MSRGLVVIVAFAGTIVCLTLDVFDLFLSRAELLIDLIRSIAGGALIVSDY